MSLPPGTLLADRFEIVREAGRGGMGTVFEARDRSTGAAVAVKVVAATADRARFEREADILESLAHPGIVRHVCHGVTSDGNPYLAMEWLSGESLHARLKRGPLAIGDAIDLAARLADALAHAHAAGVIHRDLKPSNVFLRGGAGAVVIDFGVARAEGKDLTTTGQMIGTPGYMAPEQVRGERTLDHRVDVFALGCVLYEAIAGVAPFDGGEVMEQLSRLLLEAPAPLPAAVPPRLRALIDAMIIKDARSRLASCAIARDELAVIGAAYATDDRSVLDARSPAIPVAPQLTQAITADAAMFPLAASEVATRVERPTARSRRSQWPWIVAAIAAAVGAGAIGMYLAMRGGATEPPARELDHIATPPPKPGPCDAPGDRGCEAACHSGDAIGCMFHAEALLVRDRTANRGAALAALEAGCQGLTAACVELASLLLEAPTPATTQRARSLLETACSDGDYDGCRVLAVHHRAGSVWEDLHEAYQLLDDNCATDDELACRELRDMIAKQEGTGADRREAAKVLAAACQRGTPHSC